MFSFSTAQHLNGAPWLPDVPKSNHARTDRNKRRSLGVQWIPLLRLLTAAETLGVLYLGPPSEPFDPQERVCAGSIERGVGAIAKQFMVLNTLAAVKQGCLTSGNRPIARVQNPFNPDLRSMYQGLAILLHAKTYEAPSIIQILAINESYFFNYFSITIKLEDHGSMRDYLGSCRGVQEAQAKLFCAQVVGGLHYLHSEDILHNDVNLDNILITGAGAKLTNFGNAIFNFRMQERGQLHREGRLMGTRRWAAPEQFDLNGEEVPRLLSATSDIYSLGFVVAILASGSDIFIKYSDETLDKWKLHNLILEKLPTNFIKSTWSSKILQRTLQVSPSKRMGSVIEALSLLSDVRY